jgi:hypothetical protein
MANTASAIEVSSEDEDEDEDCIPVHKVPLLSICNMELLDASHWSSSFVSGDCLIYADMFANEMKKNPGYSPNNDKKDKAQWEKYIKQVRKNMSLTAAFIENNKKDPSKVGKWVAEMDKYWALDDISKRTRSRGGPNAKNDLYSVRVKELGRSLDTVGVKLLSIEMNRSILVLSDDHPTGRLTTPKVVNEDVLCYEIEQKYLPDTCKRDDVVVIVFNKGAIGGVGHFVPTRMKNRN